MEVPAFLFSFFFASLTTVHLQLMKFSAGTFFLFLARVVLYSEFAPGRGKFNHRGPWWSNFPRPRANSLYSSTTLAKKSVPAENFMSCRYTVRSCDIVKYRLRLDIDATHYPCITSSRRIEVDITRHPMHMMIEQCSRTSWIPRLWWFFGQGLSTDLQRQKKKKSRGWKTSHDFGFLSFCTCHRLLSFSATLQSILIFLRQKLHRQKI